MGLPSSDDIKNEDLLRAAWDADGSPFKGQPFDPSKVNFGGSPMPGGAADDDGASQAEELS